MDEHGRIVLSKFKRELGIRGISEDLQLMFIERFINGFGKVPHTMFSDNCCKDVLDWRKIFKDIYIKTGIRVTIGNEKPLALLLILQKHP